MEGIRPKKPEGAKRLGFSDEIWKMVELCWLEDRSARPGVEDVLLCLNDAVASRYPRLRKEGFVRDETRRPSSQRTALLRPDRPDVNLWTM